MTNLPNDPWYGCLPSCETQVPCGQGRHIVRWEAGQLRLPEHPDAEGELVLAALGGDKADCIRLAEVWGRRVRDLSVFTVGPRGPADQTVVTWEDVEAARQRGQRGQRRQRGAAGGGFAFTSGGRRPALRQAANPPPSVAAGWARDQQERDRAQLRHTDLMALLALGYGFQARLAGQVAAAYADEPDATVRPALRTAITGRLALVAEQWLGIDPDKVTGSLHRGPGWGQAELTGPGDLRVALPADWIARVWACGLALVGGHLVVAVEQAGWPDARVLALRAPGEPPVSLAVHADLRGQRDPADVPHWEL